MLNRSVPTSTVLPHVGYPDVAEAVEWLKKTFGFKEHYRYGAPASGAQMHLGDAWIMIHGAKPEKAIQVQSLTIFTEDVEGHYQSAKAAGARILEEPHETVYGEFQYAAEDFAGHHWLFSRHARNLDPAEWGAKVAEPVTLAAAIAPMLSVRRGKQALEFYKAAFGAEVLFCIGSGDDVVAELSVGAGRFWIAEESPQHFNFSPESLGGATTRIVLTVDDPDAVFNRALAAGGKTVWPVADQPYGWRVGRLLDPFGHHWEIGKPLRG